jgi:hypothetical protein
MQKPPMQKPPYIEYLTPIHPLVHWQVRDKKKGTVLKEIGARGELVQINPTALSYPAMYCQGDEVEIVGFQNNEPIIKYVGRIEGKGKAPGCADFMVEMDEAVKAGRLK